MIDRSSLGAVLAGGASRRFGSNKALARYGEVDMLGAAVAGLLPHVREVILCGGTRTGHRTVPDRPESGLGPLGGLAGALFEARRLGCSNVLVTPVDVHPLPADLGARLAGGGAVVLREQFLVGRWPVALLDPLIAFVAQGHRALHDWLVEANARFVDDPPGLVNVNRVQDLERLVHPLPGSIE